MKYPKPLSVLLIVFVGSFIGSSSAHASAIGASNIANVGAPFGKCRKQKVATIFTQPVETAHIMSQTSIHWWTNGGFVQDAHDQFQWKNDAHKVSLFDTITLSATGAEQIVHMKTVHLAAFCRGSMVVHWEGRSKASRTC